MSDFKIFGVVHLPALPGAPHNKKKPNTILDWALRDAQTLWDSNFDGLILENFGDSPFWADTVEPHTIAQLAIIGHEIKRAAPQGFQLGINVLRNDACAALAIAHSISAEFVRVNVHSGAAWTDQGLIQGKARESLRYRQLLGAPHPMIAADVLVKHAHPAGVTEPIQLAKDTAYRAGAGALIFTGEGTGQPTDLDLLKDVRAAMPDIPIWIGSGLSPINLMESMKFADAGIIGTYLHEEGDISRPLCAQRCSEIQTIRCKLTG